MSASALETAKKFLAVWIGRAIIVTLGLVPVSCHYEITGPALWNHHSSYAFEAWLVMWIGSILIAAGAIYISVSEV